VTTRRSPRHEEIVSMEQELYFPGVRRWPLTLVRGSGSRVFDIDGAEYIDLTAGWGVTSVGHAHPAMAEAIADQARTLLQTTNVVYSIPQLELAERLRKCVPAHLRRVFFVSSGAEANEAALKLAHARTGRSRFVATHRSFHGRTLGAMGCLGQEKYRARWAAIVRPAELVPYGDLDAARAVLRDDVAAMIVEPVQGEGGVHVAPDGYLLGLAEACHRVGALLILDEIQTGVGRTGRWLALEHSGVQADIVTLGKGLGGGVPIAATLATDDVLSALKPGDHGGTYAGNLLACRAAETVLRVIEEEQLVTRADVLGRAVFARLELLAASAPSVVSAVRGQGLLLGLELRDAERAAAVHASLRGCGVLVSLTAERVLRIFPALNIPDDDLETALATIESLIGELA
jgi:acetylornithine/N-succinyldiaminopimelate aminotransferase